MASTNNTWDKNIESNESIENGKQSKQNSLKNDFLNWFKKSYIKKDSKEFVVWLNKLFSSKNITPEIKRELERYHKLRIGVFADLNIDKIEFSDLRDLFMNDFVSLNNTKQKVKEVFLKDYDISPEENDNKIWKNIFKNFSNS